MNPGMFTLNGTRNSNQKPVKPPTRSRWLRNPITYFTGGLLIVAGLQFWAFVQSERAFVAPIEADFAIQPVVGLDYLPMRLVLQNSGKSTATIEQMAIWIIHELPKEPQYYDATKIAFSPIAPGGTSSSYPRFETGWGTETTDAVLNGTMKFHIYGVIEYGDSFSWMSWATGKKITGFCFRYFPEKLSSIPDAPNFTTCPEPKYTYAR